MARNSSNNNSGGGWKNKIDRNNGTTTKTSRPLINQRVIVMTIGWLVAFGCFDSNPIGAEKDASKSSPTSVHETSNSTATDTNAPFFSTTALAGEYFNATNTTTAMPASCTNEQLGIIQHQLPPLTCRPRKHGYTRCSFSIATRCIENTWLHGLFSLSSSRTGNNNRFGIHVGCNKGLDAVNTLRMLSQSPQYDKQTWKHVFDPNQTMAKAVCQQDNYDDFPLPQPNNDSGSGTLLSPPLTHHNHHENFTATVYCVEAMPTTAERLSHASQELNWQHELVVHNYAMSSKDGVAYFPHFPDEPGVEDATMASCETGADADVEKDEIRTTKGSSVWGNARNNTTKLPPNCSLVPLYKLDTYVEKHLPHNRPLSSSHLIDFLSIDVEGFDYEVLLGASQTLHRVKYLEFEYHHVGNWPHHSLAQTIDWLRSTHGMVCYWGGHAGNLWRLTGCFQTYYEEHNWANVACVSPTLFPELAQQMETRFLETLAAGDEIEYRGKNKVDTDGRQH